MSLCNCSHQFCKNIPVSFDFITTGNQGVLFLCSPCIQRVSKWLELFPDLTPCDYFLWGYVKDKVFVPPKPVSLPDLKNRITATVETIRPDLLIRVWQELDYRLDVCRVTKCAYIERLYACIINLYSYSFVSSSIYNCVHHTCEYNQLPNRSNHFDTRGTLYSK